MKQTHSGLFLVIFLVWLVMNIRVAAGFATTFERALDGLAGGLVLLIAVFAALRFFKGGE